MPSLSNTENLHADTNSLDVAEFDLSADVPNINNREYNNMRAGAVYNSGMTATPYHDSVYNSNRRGDAPDEEMYYVDENNVFWYLDGSVVNDWDSGTRPLPSMTSTAESMRPASIVASREDRCTEALLQDVDRENQLALEILYGRRRAANALRAGPLHYQQNRLADDNRYRSQLGSDAPIRVPLHYLQNVPAHDIYRRSQHATYAATMGDINEVTNGDQYGAQQTNQSRAGRPSMHSMHSSLQSRELEAQSRRVQGKTTPSSFETGKHLTIFPGNSAELQHRNRHRHQHRHHHQQQRPVDSSPNWGNERGRPVDPDDDEDDEDDEDVVEVPRPANWTKRSKPAQVCIMKLQTSYGNDWLSSNIEAKAGSEREWRRGTC